MKKAVRILSILLALVLLVSQWTPILAAEGDGITLSMTASSQELMSGENDEVKVTIFSDKDFTSRGCGITIGYDTEVLELSGSYGAEPFEVCGPTQENKNKNICRISFMPRTEAASFSASEALAEMTFKALAPVEETCIEIKAAYFYDSNLQEISVTKPEGLKLKVTEKQMGDQENILATGIQLDKSELTLEEGEETALNATVTPENASDREVVWTSSDEKIAAVKEGMVKAIAEGSAVITAATRDGKYSVSCRVTVKIPDAGYQVTMPQDIKAIDGDMVLIPVTVSHKEAKGYNAFDMTFTYDQSVLELEQTAVSGVNVTAAEGRVHVLGYGAEKAAGSAPFALKFKVIQEKNTQVRLTEAKVDHAANAMIKNAAQAVLTDDTTEILVNGYYVTLPEGFTGDGVTKVDIDYTFARPDDYFDYTLKTTAGGKEIPILDNKDGTYTIPAELIKGEIVVTADKTGKTFPVTLGEDMSAAAVQAQHAADYTAVLKEEEGYTYTVSVTIGGKEYTGFGIGENKQKKEKSYTIPGKDITGSIIFHTEKTKLIKAHAVTFSGSGAGAALGNAVSIEEGKTYALKLKKEAGYLYRVSCKTEGQETVVIPADAQGVYVVENVTADLEFIIEKTLDIEVSLHEYVNLDEKTIFLLLVETKPESGKVYTYDGNAMYYSKAYDGWVRLIVTKEEYDTAAVKAKIAVSEGVRQMLDKPDCDVNNTGLVDINDAQLVYDMYNGKYENFSQISMIKFLNADVNMDKKVSVKDAAGVMSNIQ